MAGPKKFFIELQFAGQAPPRRRCQPQTAGVHPIAEKRDAAGRTVELDIVFECKLQPRRQKLFQVRQLLLKPRRFIGKEEKIIHVAQVAGHPQLLLEPVVKGAQVEISKMLRDQVADRQASARRRLVGGQKLGKEGEQA